MKGEADTIQLGIWLEKRYSDWLMAKGNRSREIARLVTEAYMKEKMEELQKLKKS